MNTLKKSLKTKKLIYNPNNINILNNIISLKFVLFINLFIFNEYRKRINTNGLFEYSN
jgi:hypothetical protein